MEINIPSDVLVGELMKKYYTKEEVDALIEKAKNEILSFISNNAKLVFGEAILNAPEETAKKTGKKTTKKSKQVEVPPQISPEDEKLFDDVPPLVFPEEEPVVDTKSEPTVTEAQRQQPSRISPTRPSLNRDSAPAGRVAVQPRNSEKYEYLNIDPMRFPSA